MAAGILPPRTPAWAGRRFAGKATGAGLADGNQKVNGSRRTRLSTKRNVCRVTEFAAAMLRGRPIVPGYLLTKESNMSVRRAEGFAVRRWLQLGAASAGAESVGVMRRFLRGFGGRGNSSAATGSGGTLSTTGGGGATGGVAGGASRPGNRAQPAIQKTASVSDANRNT